MLGYMLKTQCKLSLATFQVKPSVHHHLELMSPQALVKLWLGTTFGQLQKRRKYGSTTKIKSDKIIMHHLAECQVVKVALLK